jgi:hypothetical protein
MVLFYGGNVRNNTAAGIKKAPQFIPAKKDTRTKERVRERKKFSTLFFLLFLLALVIIRSMWQGNRTDGINSLLNSLLFKLLTHTIQNIPPIRLCVLVPRTANNNNFFFSFPMAIFYYFVCDSVHTHEPTREREREREEEQPNLIYKVSDHSQGPAPLSKCSKTRQR